MSGSVIWHWIVNFVLTAPVWELGLAVFASAIVAAAFYCLLLVLTVVGQNMNRHSR